jgi:hypothetical protein
MRVRSCDRCGKEIPSKEKYVKCVEVGDITDKHNHSRKMNGIGDLCLSCAKEVLKI